MRDVNLGWGPSFSCATEFTSRPLHLNSNGDVNGSSVKTSKLQTNNIAENVYPLKLQSVAVRKLSKLCVYACFPSIIELLVSFERPVIRSLSKLDGALQVLLDRVRISVLEAIAEGKSYFELTRYIVHRTCSSKFQGHVIQ